jgi:hypothetical protein
MSKRSWNSPTRSDLATRECSFVAPMSMSPRSSPKIPMREELHKRGASTPIENALAGRGRVWEYGRVAVFSLIPTYSQTPIPRGFIFRDFCTARQRAGPALSPPSPCGRLRSNVRGGGLETAPRAGSKRKRSPLSARNHPSERKRVQPRQSCSLPRRRRGQSMLICTDEGQLCNDPDL